MLFSCDKSYQLYLTFALSGLSLSSGTTWIARFGYFMAGDMDQDWGENDHQPVTAFTLLAKMIWKWKNHNYLENGSTIYTGCQKYNQFPIERRSTRLICLWPCHRIFGGPDACSWVQYNEWVFRSGNTYDGSTVWLPDKDVWLCFLVKRKKVWVMECKQNDWLTLFCFYISSWF